MLKHTNIRLQLASRVGFSRRRFSPIILYTFSLNYNHFINSVGKATAYGLDGPGIESRWEARFSPPVQTGPEAHPASCKMGTGSFPGVRCCLGVKLTPSALPVPRSKIE